MHRVAIAGFLHESNTFLSVPTGFDLFASTSYSVGPALVDRWLGGKHELSGMLAGANANGWELRPLLATFAVPSGTIEAECFERIACEMLTQLEAAGPIDGLLLALHGATVSADFPDADGEILRRIRERVGPDLPIVCTLDLHANVSRQMVRHATAITAYRSNPHLDQYDRGLEAADLMRRILTGEARPAMALETPPLVIEIAQQHTTADPARGLYDDLQAVLAWPGILSASVAMGFYYADVEEMGASFLAVADADRSLAEDAVKWMAQRAWQRRNEFVGALPSVNEAVRAAAQRELTPVVLLDVGDNVGGGSPGDSTILLEEIYRQRVSNALVVLCDPEAVKACVATGVRETIALTVGGKTDTRHGASVPIEGRIRTISDGLFTETQVRHGGWTHNDQGVTAVIETPEQHTIVLTSRRMAPMSLEQVVSLGIHPERKRILIVKGVVAPRAAYEPV
ncbi:MAG TPA: M81 family metallopeptidase, partial [Bryobacteraceae bacterium]|nr:M81 family metallopeptidase [Bryobacteraceae bacterium]